MPAIQIREFIPDTMLDQCVNILRDLTHNLLDSIDKVKDIVSDINAYNRGVADLDGKNNVSGKNIFTIYIRELSRLYSMLSIIFAAAARQAVVLSR